VTWRAAILRCLQSARWGLFAAIVVFLGLTLNTSLDRLPPILASSVQGEASAPAFEPGATFSGTWQVKALRACDGTASRWVQVDRDGSGPPWVYRLPDLPMKLSDHAAEIPGTIRFPVTSFDLPPDTPPGQARYFHVDNFVCRLPGQWFFPITVVYQPIEFRVSVPRGE
jgi:hypothetical protein